MDGLLIDSCLVKFTLDLTNYLSAGMANSALPALLNLRPADLRSALKGSLRGELAVIAFAPYRRAFALDCYGIGFEREPSGEWAVQRLSEDYLQGLISLEFKRSFDD